ncbi:potassium channel family protein [Aphanothece microscopica]
MTRHRFQLRRPHRTYKTLLAACLLLLISFTLPPTWHGISSVGYLLLGLVMVLGLGDPVDHLKVGAVPRRLFKLLGWATFVSGLLWFLTPLQLRQSGVPVLILWALFSNWSAIRLIRGLAEEQEVSMDVLRGSLAGYLMLGLAGGLICAALETTTPGSFSNINLAGSIPATEAEVYPVWSLNFVRLNYFAFVSLTTAGYGDITPLTPMAQMVSVGLAVVGTFYIAAVMGLLISRLSTVQPQGLAQPPSLEPPQKAEQQRAEQQRAEQQRDP